MTPALHTPAAPQVPGCHGRAPKQYPAGRVCTMPGCGTILRRTHKGPICDPCQDNHRCGPPASAHGEAVTTAAPAVRETKEEKVGKESKRGAVFAVFASNQSRSFNAGDVMMSSGISPSCAYKNLKALAASWEIVKVAPGEYRWPIIEDAKTAPDLIPPVPAPVIPPPEQPAKEAPASGPLPPQAGLAPFAGIKPFAGIDAELLTIGEIVRLIERLTGHETRVRVAAYVASRFL